MNLYTAVHTGNIRGFHFRFRTGSLQAVTVRAVNDGLSGFAGALTRYSSTSWGPAAPWVPRTCHADARTCWCVKHWNLLIFFFIIIWAFFYYQNPLNILRAINYINLTAHFIKRNRKIPWCHYWRFDSVDCPIRLFQPKIYDKFDAN